jgi:hypothetical protein
VPKLWRVAQDKRIPGYSSIVWARAGVGELTQDGVSSGRKRERKCTERDKDTNGGKLTLAAVPFLLTVALCCSLAKEPSRAVDKGSA